MLFNSWIFLIFFIITFALLLGLKRTKFRLYLLLAASYFFYGWLNPLYIVLIAYSTVINYFAGITIESSDRKKKLLLVAILCNVFLLGFFKYAALVVTGVAIENVFQVGQVVAVVIETVRAILARARVHGVEIVVAVRAVWAILIDVPVVIRIFGDWIFATRPATDI